jgi:hypothetical protein
MGGTDVGVTLSTASSAQSGVDQDFSNFFGAGNSSGGGSRNKWVPLALIAGAVVVSLFVLPFLISKLFKAN